MKRFSFSHSSPTLLYPHKEADERPSPAPQVVNELLGGGPKDKAFDIHGVNAEAMKENLVYKKGEEFVGMVDGLEYEESMEEMNVNVKKKRLSAEQVKELEKVFEEDRQLDPERKEKIAQEIGLQPRQVAIWFQNRRARHKTKQLERDYNLLKANYDALHLNFTQVQQEKQGLIAQLKGLKEKIGEENTGRHHSPKEPTMNLGSQNQEHRTTNYAVYNTSQLSPVELKDGSSDSDSSGVLNKEDCSLNILQLMHKISTVQRSDFNNVDDSCNIFSVDQAPELYW